MSKIPAGEEGGKRPPVIRAPSWGKSSARIILRERTKGILGFTCAKAGGREGSIDTISIREGKGGKKKKEETCTTWGKKVFCRRRGGREEKKRGT